MLNIKGIQYVVDENGRKKAVIISYKAFKELMEDMDDLRVARERHDEPAMDFEKVIAELRDEGRLITDD